MGVNLEIPELDCEQAITQVFGPEPGAGARRG